MTERDAHVAFLRELVPRVLGILDEGGAQATFFVVASLYDDCPELIHRIEDAGHEIGWHSHGHPRLEDRETLERELTASARFLETFRPRGFRAPYLYLPEALVPALAGHGFAYDSSTLGPPGAVFERDGLVVFPVTSLPWWGSGAAAPRYPVENSAALLARELPVGTGIMASWLRPAYGALLRRCERRGRPCVFYLHPWQLGGDPRLAGLGWRSGLRYIHAFPLDRWLARLVGRHRFRRLDARLSPGDAGREPAHFLTIDFE